MPATRALRTLAAMGILDRFGRFLDDVLLLPDDLREALSTAESALEEGKYESAEEIYLAVLAERPTLARAALGLAHARAALGDADGTWAAVLEARELVSFDGELAAWAAELALERGELGTAQIAARDAIRARSRIGGRALAEAYALRAEVERRRGRPDRAARDLRKAAVLEGRPPERLVEVVEALAETKRAAEVRSAARELDAAALAPRLSARVARALASVGAPDAALRHFQAASRAGDPIATVELGRAALGAGQMAKAEQAARKAVASGGGVPALELLGEVLIHLRKGGEAAEAFAHAARIGGDVDHVRAAVRTVPVDDQEALARHAETLEAAAPGDPAAAPARAFAAFVRDEVDLEALALVGDEPRGALARAEHALRDGRPAEAIAEIERFQRLAELAPWALADQALSAELRRRALRSLWMGPEGEVDLPAAIDAAMRFAEEHGLDDAFRRAQALRDELDRPLLLTVLGEFNAGKSTLINAIIGAEVAPMGVLPTTATLNLLRGGRDRRVRVVRSDGSTREGEYDALRALLAWEGEESGPGVDRVEIILPSEMLERVWILDAPGTNALAASHERLAWEAARRADVVLWIYDAAQAGKRTEGIIMERVREAGRPIVPVLNKIDRLDEEERERVFELLRRAFPAEAPPIPLCARRALESRIEEDRGGLEESGFPELMRHLESRVFRRSRELKRAACAGRLLSIIDDALETEAVAVRRYEEGIARLNATLGRLVGFSRSLREHVDRAVVALEEAHDRAFEAAADEVLATVRPRATQLGRNDLDREDRRFVEEVLHQRLMSGARGVQEVLVAALLLSLPSSDAEEGDGALRDRLDAAVAFPLAMASGLERGRLSGPRLHHLFDEVLPRTPLTREALSSGLAEGRVDLRAELRPALEHAIEELVATLEQDRLEAAERMARERNRVQDQVYGPLRALRAVLAELSLREARQFGPSSGSG